MCADVIEHCLSQPRQAAGTTTDLQLKHRVDLFLLPHQLGDPKKHPGRSTQVGTEVL